MASQLSTANWALDLIGDKRLSALSDDNERAEQISEAWDDIRDVALRRAAWKFSLVRAYLESPDTDAPVWGFDYQFTLPGDCLRVIEVGTTYVGVDLNDYRQSDNAEFRIEGAAPGKLLTSLWDEDVPIRYVKRVTNVGEWDVTFAKLVAADLAERINPRITESEAIQQRLMAWRQSAMTEAFLTNAIEIPPISQGDSEWIASRYS